MTVICLWTCVRCIDRALLRAEVRLNPSKTATDRKGIKLVEFKFFMVGVVVICAICFGISMDYEGHLAIAIAIWATGLIVTISLYASILPDLWIKRVLIRRWVMNNP
jgi:hypothetical protein